MSISPPTVPVKNFHLPFRPGKKHAPPKERVLFMFTDQKVTFFP